jgi:regulator of sigma E protease
LTPGLCPSALDLLFPFTWILRSAMLTLVAFVLALGLLIAVHEYGHYRVAVACGVKVLRFSVGFGKPLLTWQRKGSPTEFVLCALPFGRLCAHAGRARSPGGPG